MIRAVTVIRKATERANSPSHLWEHALLIIDVIIIIGVETENKLSQSGQHTGK